MSLIEVILLATALGIDCCVVSFSQGIIFRRNRVINSAALAVTMGLCQGLMPFAGYYGATFAHKYVESFTQWIVFGIFLALGIKFILDAFRQKKDELFCISPKCLAAMGIATSIDALAAGISIKFSHESILIPALLIGCVSFVMSLCGFWTGNSFKNFPSKSLEIIGGSILIGLAIKAII